MNRYHYTDCGLPNVYLSNGYTFSETPYGETVSIDDLDGLHATIGMSLVNNSETLNGDEVRFLRHELDLSQRMLADMLGVQDQTVARWEKGKVAITGPAQKLLGLLYRESVEGRTEIKVLLERLSELDAQMHKHELILALDEDVKEWALCA